MNAFTFRDQIVQSYERFSRSFVKIAATDISKVVDVEYERGRYWPESLIQIKTVDLGKRGGREGKFTEQQTVQ